MTSWEICQSVFLRVLWNGSTSTPRMPRYKLLNVNYRHVVYFCVHEFCLCTKLKVFLLKSKTNDLDLWVRTWAKAKDYCQYQEHVQLGEIVCRTVVHHFQLLPIAFYKDFTVAMLSKKCLFHKLLGNLTIFYCFTDKLQNFCTGCYFTTASRAWQKFFRWWVNNVSFLKLQ